MEVRDIEEKDEPWHGVLPNAISTTFNSSASMWPTIQINGDYASPMESMQVAEPARLTVDRVDARTPNQKGENISPFESESKKENVQQAKDCKEIGNDEQDGSDNKAAQQKSFFESGQGLLIGKRMFVPLEKRNMLGYHLLGEKSWRFILRFFLNRKLKAALVLCLIFSSQATVAWMATRNTQITYAIYPTLLVGFMTLLISFLSMNRAYIPHFVRSFEACYLMIMTIIMAAMIVILLDFHEISFLASMSVVMGHLCGVVAESSYLSIHRFKRSWNKLVELRASFHKNSGTQDIFSCDNNAAASNEAYSSIHTSASSALTTENLQTKPTAASIKSKKARTCKKLRAKLSIKNIHVLDYILTHITQPDARWHWKDRMRFRLTVCRLFVRMDVLFGCINGLLFSLSFFIALSAGLITQYNDVQIDVLWMRWTAIEIVQSTTLSCLVFFSKRVVYLAIKPLQANSLFYFQTVVPLGEGFCEVYEGERRRRLESLLYQKNKGKEEEQDDLWTGEWRETQAQSMVSRQNSMNVRSNDVPEYGLSVNSNQSLLYSSAESIFFQNDSTQVNVDDEAELGEGERVDLSAGLRENQIVMFSSGSYGEIVDMSDLIPSRWMKGRNYLTDWISKRIFFWGLFGCSSFGLWITYSVSRDRHFLISAFCLSIFFLPVIICAQLNSVRGLAGQSVQTFETVVVCFHSLFLLYSWQSYFSQDNSMNVFWCFAFAVYLSSILPLDSRPTSLRQSNRLLHLSGQLTQQRPSEYEKLAHLLNKTYLCLLFLMQMRNSLVGPKQHHGFSSPYRAGQQSCNDVGRNEVRIINPQAMAPQTDERSVLRGMFGFKLKASLLLLTLVCCGILYSVFDVPLVVVGEVKNINYFGTARTNISLLRYSILSIMVFIGRRLFFLIRHPEKCTSISQGLWVIPMTDAVVQHLTPYSAILDELNNAPL